MSFFFEYFGYSDVNSHSINQIDNNLFLNNHLNDLSLNDSSEIFKILSIKIDQNDLLDRSFIYGCEKIFREISLSHESNKVIFNNPVLKDPQDIKGIIFEINSPGGYCESLLLNNSIQILKEKLDIPIVSHVKNGCSAAYMLPSLCSDRIFLSDSGEIGAVGIYEYEENYFKILKEIGIDAHIFHSEQTSSIKYHNSNLPISKEIEEFKNKTLTKSF